MPAKYALLAAEGMEKNKSIIFLFLRVSVAKGFLSRA